MIFLIIDQEKHWANYVKRFLENKGHQVEILEDYEKASEITRKRDFDLIFYDSLLFKENQKFISRLIMQKSNNRVVITSALPNYKEAMCAKRYGAVDYIDKLYDGYELLKIISENIKSTNIKDAYLKRILMEEELCP